MDYDLYHAVGWDQVTPQHTSYSYQIFIIHIWCVSAHLWRYYGCCSHNGPIARSDQICEPHTGPHTTWPWPLHSWGQESQVEDYYSFLLRLADIGRSVILMTADPLPCQIRCATLTPQLFCTFQVKWDPTEEFVASNTKRKYVLLTAVFSHIQPFWW